MDFSSDTSAPAHPDVIAALAQANTGNAPSYGADAVTARVRGLLAQTFETEDFEFWICASGTASNALALSVMCSPIGSVICHEEAHIERDERGAPEFFTGGAKLRLLPGFGAQIDEAALKLALAGIDRDFVHETPAEAVSLTNLTECGTAYSAGQVARYAAMAKGAGLNVHLDGARLANALVSTKASPAEMTWKAGIDVVTLGLTKTGAIGCELIVLFGAFKSRISDLKARAKRSGHMPPKMRFLAAQAEAMLKHGLWLQLASEANRKAGDLASALLAVGAELAYPVDGNEVFVILSGDQVDTLRAAGAAFYPWPGGSQRFVCSWAVPDSAITDLAAVLA